MIVSASYRTDIPAFYGDWLLARLDAGFCEVASPYGGRSYRVDLGPDAVDGFVFWTRNVRPFLPVLAGLAAAGVPFVVQYTITGAPAVLEPAVPGEAQALAAAREVARRFGPHTLVWRYDPILVTSLTPAAFHRATFARLAAALEGATDEVVVSFADLYRKTVRNLARAREADARLAWRDPPLDEKRALLRDLVETAADHGMTLTLCTEPALVEAASGLAAARCIDADRLSRIAGRTIAARQKGNRPGCLCAESRDVGAYDTCIHGCVYCYAVSDRGRALRRHAMHDAGNERLSSPPPARSAA